MFLLYLFYLDLLLSKWFSLCLCIFLFLYLHSTCLYRHKMESRNHSLSDSLASNSTRTRFCIVKQRFTFLKRLILHDAIRKCICLLINRISCQKSVKFHISFKQIFSWFWFKSHHQRATHCLQPNTFVDGGKVQEAARDVTYWCPFTVRGVLTVRNYKISTFIVHIADSFLMFLWVKLLRRGEGLAVVEKSIMWLNSSART